MIRNGNWLRFCVSVEFYIQLKRITSLCFLQSRYSSSAIIQKFLCRTWVLIWLASEMFTGRCSWLLLCCSDGGSSGGSCASRRPPCDKAPSLPGSSCHSSSSFVFV